MKYEINERQTKRFPKPLALVGFAHGFNNRYNEAETVASICICFYIYICIWTLSGSLLPLRCGKTLACQLPAVQRLSSAAGTGILMLLT